MSLRATVNGFEPFSGICAFVELVDDSPAGCSIRLPPCAAGQGGVVSSYLRFLGPVSNSVLAKEYPASRNGWRGQSFGPSYRPLVSPDQPGASGGCVSTAPRRPCVAHLTLIIDISQAWEHTFHVKRARAASEFGWVTGIRCAQRVCGVRWQSSTAAVGDLEPERLYDRPARRQRDTDGPIAHIAQCLR